LTKGREREREKADDYIRLNYYASNIVDKRLQLIGYNKQ
jgi:hypothetical protein